MTKHQIVKSTLRRLRSIYSSLRPISKSDKINVLRKQYDAFLEEDKKRKDRNEYILGRMETMRSCTTLVHVRKAYPKTEEYHYSSQPKYNGTMAHISNNAIALSGRAHVTPNYTNNNYDEPTLLKEISKKYFLIPKVMSNVFSNVNFKEKGRDPSPVEDNDWKSKYNILEELKREEKGQSDTKYEKPNDNLGDPHEDNKHSEYIAQESNEKSTVPNNNNPSLEPAPMKPVVSMLSNKQLSAKNSEVKTNQNREQNFNKTINDNILATAESNIDKHEFVPQSNNVIDVVNLPARVSPAKESVAENKTKQDTMLLSNNNETHEIKKSNELCVEKLAPKMEPIEVLENNKYLPEEKTCNEFNESQDNTVHYAQNNANNNLSTIVNNENITEQNNENNTLSVKNIEDRQEFVQENTVRAQGVYEEVAGTLKDEPALDETVHQEYQHQESNLNQIQNIEQNVTSEVNDELETEQKEMFYGEDNEKDNEYNENEEATYPAENENYINQEYSYYDESQKEQIYPTEINEHEESTERYDPNYEQQYVNNYDTGNTQFQPEQYDQNSYDQQNVYDQQQSELNYQPENPNYEYAPMEGDKEVEQNQMYYTNAQENAQYEVEQFDNTEVVDQPNTAYTSEYDAQQEYITTHTEHQNIENVEQQLDVEDGYVPNSNKNEENPEYQEQVIEETSDIQQTDIKLT